MKLSTITKYYLIWQLAIIMVTSIAPKILSLRETYIGIGTKTYITNPLLFSRANFDGNHYIRIARNGHGYAQQAFFPLYSNLIKKLAPLVKNDALAGVLISSTSFFLAAIIFVKLIRLDYSPAVAKYSLLALILFPTSFYFGAVYTEGLFIFLVLASFYSARTKHWWMAGIFGALAANTRFIGIFLLPALLIEWWPQRNIRHLLPILLIPLGLISYMLFLQKTVGDPLAFVHVQQLFGQGRSDNIVLIYQVFWRYLKMIFTVNRADPLYLTIMLEFATGVIFLATSIYSLFRYRLSYAVFGLLNFFLPTLTGSFTSLPRYVLASFVSFIALGKLLSQTSVAKRRFIFGVISCLFVLFLSLFTRGYWVS